MTRKSLLLIAFCAGLNAQQTPAPQPLSREAQLELQVIAIHEKEVADKIQPLYEMLMEPVRQARAAAVERACKAAGIPLQEHGEPTCEVDTKAGTVRRIKAPEPKKEK